MGELEQWTNSGTRWASSIRNKNFIPQIPREYSTSVRAANAMSTRIKDKKIARAERVKNRFDSRFSHEMKLVQDFQKRIQIKTLPFNDGRFQKERAHSANPGLLKAEKEKGVGEQEQKLQKDTSSETNSKALSGDALTSFKHFNGGFKNAKSAHNPSVNQRDETSDDEENKTVTQTNTVLSSFRLRSSYRRRRAKTSLGFAEGTSDNWDMSRSYRRLREAYKKEVDEKTETYEDRFRQMQEQQKRSHELLLERSRKIFKDIIEGSLVDMNQI
ncbi:hypothetical protein CHS0354_034710 [Potamilus streckersoni]|uniref:Uncharacterized protein n=1 Tax=Potamilus streckersoni TaxID=2493646 RepID=A0AAE0VWK5_9BIVA|nr:hypothetical protein CHS0354_034710 [Potamilus streckersoni]